jgi:hypothetical protein
MIPKVKIFVGLSENRKRQTFFFYCPFCDCFHFHNAGAVGDDPGKYIGKRTSHCFSNYGMINNERFNVYILSRYSNGHLKMILKAIEYELELRTKLDLRIRGINNHY